MNFLTKLVIALFTVAATVVTSIVGGMDYLDKRTEVKVSEAKKEVKAEIIGLHKQDMEKVHALDGKFMAEVNGVKAQLISMDQKLNILIGLSKRNSFVLAPIREEPKGKKL